MLKKSIRDKFIGFGFALAVGLTSAGFAVLGSSPIEATADVDYDSGIVENLSGSVWYFSAPPTITGFPDNGDSHGYYSIGCYYDYYTPNGGLIADSCNGIGYDSTSGNWQFIYSSGATGMFLYNAYIRFTSSAVFSRAGHSSDYTNNLDQLIWWLFNNAELLQMPTEPISSAHIPDALDVGHVALFDLGRFIGNATYGLRNIVHVDFLDTSGNLTFSWRASATWLPYQITFDKMEYGNGLAVTAVDFVLVEGYPYENGYVFNCPFGFQMQGNNNLICWNYELGFDNISASSRSATNDGLFYRSVVFNSSSVSQFTTNKLNIAKFFGLYREGPQYGFQYRWLDRQAYIMNAYMQYGYRWIITDSVTYQNGYDAGKTAGYDQGYQEGYNLARETAYDEGKAQGYQEGYNAGVNSVSTGSTAIVSLFGGIASVPINILNGLSEFTIWNVPIINILVTFLFIGLIAFVIRKLVV